MVSHLDSQQLIRLIAQGSSGTYFQGDYRFDSLHCGLSLHGGSMKAECDACIRRLSAGYISFVILLEGEIDFAVNRHRYRIRAEGGKIILLAVPDEFLFSRYLHQGCTTAKITLKGLDYWLKRPEYRHLLPAVYQETVRHWPLPDTLRRQALQCLPEENTSLAGRLAQEAAALDLLAALWQSFVGHYPLNTQNPPAKPSEPFSGQLNRAFAEGAHQVAELAAALHISERSLQRRLRECMGLTVSDWLRHKHMQYALHALTSGRQSISEIAYRCGYKHPSSFTQAFKQYFNCTPAEIRKQDGAAAQ